MSEDDFDSLPFQAPDALNRFFRSDAVGMNAAYVAMDVVPLADFLLLPKDSPVVARITGKTDPFLPTALFHIVHLCQKVNMTRKMTWCIDDVNTAVLENV